MSIAATTHAARFRAADTPELPDYDADESDLDGDWNNQEDHGDRMP